MRDSSILVCRGCGRKKGRWKGVGEMCLATRSCGRDEISYLQLSMTALRMDGRARTPCEGSFNFKYVEEEVLACN